MGFHLFCWKIQPLFRVLLHFSCDYARENTFPDETQANVASADKKNKNRYNEKVFLFLLTIAPVVSRTVLFGYQNDTKQHYAIK